MQQCSCIVAHSSRPDNGGGLRIAFEGWTKAQATDEIEDRFRGFAFPHRSQRPPRYMGVLRRRRHQDTGRATRGLAIPPHPSIELTVPASRRLSHVSTLRRRRFRISPRRRLRCSSFAKSGHALLRSPKYSSPSASFRCPIITAISTHDTWRLVINAHYDRHIPHGLSDSKARDLGEH